MRRWTSDFLSSAWPARWGRPVLLDTRLPSTRCRCGGRVTCDVARSTFTLKCAAIVCFWRDVFCFRVSWIPFGWRCTTATFQSRTYAQDRFKATSRNLHSHTRQVVQAVMVVVIMMTFAVCICVGVIVVVVDDDDDTDADTADVVASDVCYFYSIS
jgi:hypothetical protein